MFLFAVAGIACNQHAKRTVYSGHGVRDRTWPFLGNFCCGVSLPDNSKHKQFYLLHHGLPSAHSVKAGWLTHSWPNARPMTLYQTDCAMFISLRAGGGAFWYSQVEAIDSLCTVVIYSVLQLFCGIRIKEYFSVLQRGASCHHTFTWVAIRKPTVNPSHPSIFSNRTVNSKRNNAAELMKLNYLKQSVL